MKATHMTAENQLRLLLDVPPLKRKPPQIAAIVEIVSYLGFFKRVSDIAGSKTLFEYCRNVELTNVTLGCPLSHNQQFYILLNGRVISRSHQTVLREYCSGQQIGFCSAQLQYIAKQQSHILFFRKPILRRLNSIQNTTQILQKKKYDAQSKHSGQALQAMFKSLSNCSIIKQLPLFDIRQLVLHSSLKYYKKYQTVYQQYKYPHYIYILKEGQVGIKYHPSNNTQLLKVPRRTEQFSDTISKVNPGDVFGLQQVILQSKYSTSADTLADSYIISISSDIFRQVLSPLYNKKITQNLMSLIRTKSVLTERAREYQKSRMLRANINQDLSDTNSNKKLISMQTAQQQQGDLFRSHAKTRPYSLVLPSNLIHKQPLTRKFKGNHQDLNLGLIEQELKKTRTKTLTPINKQRRPPSHKYIYQRIIIKKLEEYQTMDQAKFLQLTRFDSSQARGSTLNFFKSRQRFNQRNRENASMNGRSLRIEQQ